MEACAPGSLLRKSPSGENHLLLLCFIADCGLKTLLWRQRKGSMTAPDLFETGDYCYLEKPGKPLFVREYHMTRSHAPLARDYAALSCAAALAGFLEKNLLHLETFDIAWDLWQRALAALMQRPTPQLVLFKALFAFARSEGYPVAADWMQRQPAQKRTAIAAALRAPADTLSPPADEISRWITSLNQYFRGYTALLPVEPLDLTGRSAVTKGA